MKKTLGAFVGAGYTAEIYHWEPGWVVKLFHDWVPRDWVVYEEKIARSVCATGYSAPLSGSIVEINGRNGLLYQFVDGPSIIKLIGSNAFSIRRVGEIMAELHAEMHRLLGESELPDIHERLAEKIRNAKMLPNNLSSDVLLYLDSLENGDRLCHNDFHPDNILITDEGPRVIDWMDASRGSPFADVARTLIMLKVGSLPPIGLLKKVFIQLFRRIILRRYLLTYYRLTGCRKQDIERWIPVVAAARLESNLPGEEKPLMKLIRKGLKQYG